MSSNVDLVKLFSTVAETLVENQASLNKADEYNQDHGDHMVDIFQMITGAVKEAPKNDLSSGLAKASKALVEKPSGSADITLIFLTPPCSSTRNRSRTNPLMFLRLALKGYTGFTLRIKRGGWSTSSRLYMDLD